MEGPVESKNILSDYHFADIGTDFPTQDELEVSVFIPLRWLSSSFRLRLRKIARKLRPTTTASLSPAAALSPAASSSLAGVVVSKPVLLALDFASGLYARARCKS